MRNNQGYFDYINDFNANNEEDDDDENDSIENNDQTTFDSDYHNNMFIHTPLKEGINFIANHKFDETAANPNNNQHQHVEEVPTAYENLISRNNVNNNNNENNTARTTRRKVGFGCGKGNRTTLSGKFDDEYEEDSEVDPLFTLTKIEDRIEDEIDTTASDLLPLRVQLWTEQNVFGWSHLLSDILGHVLYTGLSAFFAYNMVNFCLLRNGMFAKWFISDHANSGSSNDHDGNEEEEEEIPDDINPIWNMSPTSFYLIRFFITSLIAVTSYRTVRRRRQIWLHSAYGTRAYERDANRRRDTLLEVDRSTPLGKTLAQRGKEAWRARNMRTKLKKAKKRFERKHSHGNMLALMMGGGGNSCSSSGYNTPTRGRKSGNVTPTKGRRGVVGGGNGVGGILKYSSRFNNRRRSSSWDDKIDPIRKTRSRSNSGRSTPRKRLQRQRSKSEQDVMELDGFSSTPYYSSAEEEEEDDEGDYEEDIHPQASSSQHHAHHAATTTIQSVCQDQVAITPIDSIPYAHGGFFGAAPFMLGNHQWVEILRTLMPDVYVEVARRIFYPTPQLIHWAENNPVVAAFGTTHEHYIQGKMTTLEWDVFVDPCLVKKLYQVIEMLDMVLTSDDNNSTTSTSNNLYINASRAQTIQILQNQIKRQSLHLLSKMLIAHGSVPQLMLEQLGKWKKYNFSRVRRSRRTLGGGIYARQWLAVYAQALKLAATGTNSTPFEDENGDDASYASSYNSNGSEYDNPNDYHHHHNDEDHLIQTCPIAQRDYYNEIKDKPNPYDHLSTCPNTTMKSSISTIKQIMGCAPGVILDLKSRHVPKKVWAALVESLRDCGARVEGIASFTIEEIMDISRYLVVPVREIFFFHSAGDVQYACQTGKIRRGDSVFFNAGSLLWDRPREWNGMEVFCGKTRHAAKLMWRKFDTERTKREYKFQGYALFPADKDVASASAVDKNDDNSDDNDVHRANHYQDDSSVGASKDIYLLPLLLPSDSNDITNTTSNTTSHQHNPISPKHNTTTNTTTTSTTIADYKNHYNLNLGLYCQEFAVDEVAINIIIKHVNARSSIYNLGLAWGGVNGITVKGVQPTRFTSTDGFWNQRYMGIRWNNNVGPEDDLHPDFIDDYFFGARSGELVMHPHRLRRRRESMSEQQQQQELEEDVEEGGVELGSPLKNGKKYQHAHVGLTPPSS